MLKKFKTEAKVIESRLADFFWVHFDAKTSRKVTLHPEMAIPLLNEKMKDGLRSKGLLSLYASAMNDAVAFMELRTAS